MASPRGRFSNPVIFVLRHLCLLLHIATRGDRTSGYDPVNTYWCEMPRSRTQRDLLGVVVERKKKKDSH